MDGIFQTLLKDGREVLIPYLLNIFRAFLANGYVPAIREVQVKVVFTHKPDRNFYGGPKDFRHISVTYSYLSPWADR